VERHHGSSEETWSQSRGKERRGHTRPEQGSSQCLGEKGCSHARTEQGGQGGGEKETQIARLLSNETEKPAMSPAFLRSSS
jgi:hypothetical protein